jgi:hypothetical protein
MLESRMNNNNNHKLVSSWPLLQCGRTDCVVMESRVDANLLETQRISSHGTLSWCFCFKELRDRQTALIISVAALYYLSSALSSIPLKLLINKRISGDAEDPNAK